jgi:hypothetical protein
MAKSFPPLHVAWKLAKVTPVINKSVDINICLLTNVFISFYWIITYHL